MSEDQTKPEEASHTNHEMRISELEAGFKKYEKELNEMKIKLVINFLRLYQNTL